jgi:hypothetical protein
MDGSQEVHPSIQKLLEVLDQEADDHVGRTTLTGRAVSRSADNVHLAVRGGIVAVPIANIDEVVSLSRSEPDAVRLAVRDPRAIQPLFRVNSGGSLGGGTPGGAGSIDTARDGETIVTDRTWQVYQGVGTCTYTDTDTLSGGNDQPDQLDDCPPDSCPADDEAG